MSRTVRIKHYALGLVLLSVFPSFFSPQPLQAQVLLPGLNAARSTSPAELEFRTGLTALEQNDAAGAEAAFKRSLALDSKASGPHMGLAQVALRRGDKPDAERHLKQALALAPESAAAQTAWGTFLYASGDYPEAEIALRKAVTLSPTAVAARIHLGDMYLMAFRKPREAATEYREAIKIEPNHPGAHYALGLALSELSDVAGAETELRTAAKLSPTNPLAHHALGKLYALSRQLEKAIAEFDTAIKLAPAFAAPHLEKGHLLLARGDDAGAIKEYGQAQNKDPKRSLGLMYIGMTHQQKQRWPQAEEAYLGAVKIDPRNAVAFNNLAWMAAERKVNLKQALTWAQQAVSINPNLPEFQGTLGWVYRAQGDLVRAESTLMKAAAIKPQRAVIVYNLGRVYLERGKKSEAAAELKRALALDGSFPGADEARGLLKQLGQG